VTATVPTGPDPHGVAYRPTAGPATIARNGEMGWEMGRPGGPRASVTGQPRMMGQDMMDAGTCCGGVCQLPAAASTMGSSPDLWGMLGLSGLQREGPMDPKTRGQQLQLRGELLKAMGEVLVKHGKLMTEGQ
jgi:hypothetical protein